MAEIQFYRGTPEEVIPEVRLTRSRTGNSGTATFIFNKPEALSQANTTDITGMYLVDSEGELVSREVKARFINGQPEALEGTYIMRSAEDWDRFMRFMERYAQEHGLDFSKS